MPNQNHEPAAPAMPAFSTRSSLRTTLEDLKGGGEFQITIEIGGETDAAEPVPAG